MSDLKKQPQKHEKPKTVHVYDALSHTCVSSGLKDSERVIRIVKMIQGVHSHQRLEIC